MDNATYLKNVLKTFSNKPAKAGLRRVAGNTVRTYLMHAAIGMQNEMTELFTVIEDWLSGARQWSPDFNLGAKDELGDVGYFMRVLSRYLHIKLPSATKKAKLKGMTRTAALLRMNTLSGQIMSLQKKNFYGPIFTAEGKLDKDATAKQEQDRNVKAAELLAEFVQLYWAICYELIGETPDTINDANIAKLAVRYPDGFFDAAKEAGKDPEAEKAAVASA